MANSHKDVAVEFMRLVASGKVREAYEKHVGAGFRHHKPYFRGDAASLMKGMEENAAKNLNKQLEIQCAIQEGDRVAVFVSLSCGTLDRLCPSNLSMRTACSDAKATT